MMNEMFPLMQTMHHEEATGPTECQDLLGMSFRTVHFDGFAPRAVVSGLGRPTATWTHTYRYHRRVLRLLQWHCPPRLWHLKTPVHMFALDSLLAAYPDAKFLWSHRDPAKVLGSVCSLIHYVRSWASDRDDSLELGAEQLGRWSEAIDAGDGLPGPGRRRPLRRPGVRRPAERPGRGAGRGVRADRHRVPRPVPRGRDAAGPAATSRERTASTRTSWRSSASTPTRCTSASPATWSRTMPRREPGRAATVEGG